MEPTSPELAEYQLVERAKSGARWFYWIAGLSLINTFSHLAGSTWSFIAGLGITQVVDGLVGESGEIARGFGLMFNLAAAGVFVLIGYWAHRRRAPFIVGIVLYALDGVIFLLVQEWIGVAFHAFVIFSIMAGYKAATELEALGRTQAPPPVTVPVPIEPPKDPAATETPAP